VTGRLAGRAGAIIGAILLAGAAAAAADNTAGKSQVAASALLGADIATLSAALAGEQVSAAELAGAYLDRIDRIDRGELGLSALITLHRDVVDEAGALDRERGTSGRRGPLHGLPVIVADNLDTAGIPTSGGAAALRGHVPAEDATVVARLRDAGVLIIGKGNLSELGRDLGLPGYSSAGGQTLNPYRRSRGAAGTAAAVAADLAAAGIAADTLGGLRGQAAGCGLVGVRPTLGLTSRAGLIPAALSLDVTGPLARGVRDAAVLLGVMAGVDGADPRTADAESHEVGDYTLFLDAGALDGARLGVARDYRGGNREVDAALREALAALRAAGAELVDIDVPRRILEAHGQMLAKVLETELADQLRAYLRDTADGLPHGLETLLRISRSPLIQGSPTPVNPARLEAYAAALASPGLADVDYLTVLGRRMPAARDEIAELLRARELDALVFPTVLCPAASRYDAYDDRYDCDADDPDLPAYLASSTGFPEVTVPMGWTDAGLPLGLSFFGPAFAEPRLLGLAYAFEQATGHRRPLDLSLAAPDPDGQDEAPR
jgi:amidase